MSSKDKDKFHYIDYQDASLYYNYIIQTNRNINANYKNNKYQIQKKDIDIAKRLTIRLVDFSVNKSMYLLYEYIQKLSSNPQIIDKNNHSHQHFTSIPAPVSNSNQNQLPGKECTQEQDNNQHQQLFPCTPAKTIYDQQMATRTPPYTNNTHPPTPISTIKDHDCYDIPSPSIIKIHRQSTLIPVLPVSTPLFFDPNANSSNNYYYNTKKPIILNENIDPNMNENIHFNSYDTYIKPNIFNCNNMFSIDNPGLEDCLTDLNDSTLRNMEEHKPHNDNRAPIGARQNHNNKNMEEHKFNNENPNPAPIDARQDNNNNNKNTKRYRENTVSSSLKKVKTNKKNTVNLN
ncbi:hypothetical protein PPL_03497 (plasmid) [Heterostelium pallidum]|uniref:Uncharacterized protein n=1 Tax=Heterostelium pallidum (strain ATCC 26659 / Pp 5 / PN500) TaxID=670386 RepID=D3EMQ5_HETP5|nr:hypothetical protein PPL_03497 [Heterostelium pallidum]ADC31704.1 hypothetical protein PPL_03497 [Heterostelium pallidum]|eukprot:YP_003422568.1 hypothetical protein PPL_03497 (plasmid) [Heterostelium pallidum]